MSIQPRICLVDDDPSIREAAALALGDEGLDVTVAGTFGEAVEVIAERGADVILTDLQLPGLADAEVVSRLRRRFPRTPIIAVSSDARAGAAARDHGARLVLMKPVAALAMALAINRVLAECAIMSLVAAGGQD